MLTAGIDIGAETVKLALVDGETIVEQKVMLHKGLSGTPLKIAIAGWLQETGVSLNGIKYTLGVGSVSEVVEGVTEIVREPVCVAKGVSKMQPSVRTAVGIGAEKTTVVKCQGGKPIKVVTNEQCAAGTGKYLEIIADLVGIGVEEMGLRAAKAASEVEMASTCAVFAESEAISLIHEGRDIDGILMGACKALATRVYSSMINVGLEKDVMLYGGVARNAGVVKALEEQIGSKLYIPEVPEAVAALGAAFMAQERVVEGVCQ